MPKIICALIFVVWFGWIFFDNLITGETGHILYKRCKVRRQERPVHYWCSMTIILALLLFVLGLAIMAIHQYNN